MRLQLHLVVFYGFLVVSLPDSAWAGQAEKSDAQFKLRVDPPPAVVEYSPLTFEPSRASAKGAPTKPQSVKDLLLQTKPSEPGQKPLDTLSVEPWMPGRGSVGVKLEMTW